MLRTKSIEQSIRDTEESEHKLKKNLSALDLTGFGIGVIIGTGIFVLTRIAAATRPVRRCRCRSCSPASPAPWPPSATPSSPGPCRWPAAPDTFSYASLGELIAWIIGWDLVLEFALGSAAVSVGRAKYFASVFPIPGSISGDGPVNLAAPRRPRRPRRPTPLRPAGR